MKDHWIPKFYLKGFLDNNSEKLYVFNKKSNTGYFKSPKSICRSENYYHFSNVVSGNERIIDDFFTRIVENNAAPIIKKISSDSKYKPTIEDKRKLALFISFLRIRVPKFGKTAKEFIEKPIQDYLKKLSELKGAENFIKTYEEETGLKSDMKPEDFLEFIKSYSRDYEVPKNIYFLYRMFSIGIKQVDLILDMDWSFVYASPKRAFITCDNPFVLSSEGKVDRDKIVPITDPKIAKIISLSKSVCLFIGDKNNNSDTYRKFESSGGQRVRTINTFFIINSDELIIGGNENIIQRLLE